MIKKRVRDLLVNLKMEGYDILKAYVGARDSETYWLPEKADSLQDYMLHCKVIGSEDAPLLLIDDVLQAEVPARRFNGIVRYDGKCVR
ncbi:hypothetical protein [Sphingobacterium yanglingense]|uniref:Uncharacterized protein n=1 Tax=Sphingobacterium yanglingense TaxID=1437280 RepID=A0A4R6WIF9_9SPHI|nr:hypothetical protein [Sphingobacterium yanglingense]TDQ80023.1 hypothetical protein CLV99_1477 [Sphingobacterium yanglingense]